MRSPALAGAGRARFYSQAVCSEAVYSQALIANRSA
jgi:hypothetical protein